MTSYLNNPFLSFLRNVEHSSNGRSLVCRAHWNVSWISKRHISATQAHFGTHRKPFVASRSLVKSTSLLIGVKWLHFMNFKLTYVLLDPRCMLLDSKWIIASSMFDGDVHENWESNIELQQQQKTKTSNSPLLLLKCFSFFNDNHLKIFIAARSRSEMCWITIAQRNQPYNVSMIEAQQLIMTPKWEPISGHSCIQLIERNVNFFLLFLSCSLSLIHSWQSTSRIHFYSRL